MSTYTSLNLTGPQKAFGAYLKNVSSSFGSSTNPSTCQVTLVEDGPDAIFEPPILGKYYKIEIGTNWSFEGIVVKYEMDTANIGGRTINVTINDVREIMKSIPMILAPGSQGIVAELGDHQCAILDIYGSYYYGDSQLFNLSGWNQTGMEFTRIVSALHGDTIQYGTLALNIPKLTADIYRETFSFDFSELVDRVNPFHRVNTNLITISELIEDLSGRNAFDWFIESTRGTDNVISVRIKIIDRSTDNEEISFQEFIDLHEDKVISASSGIELRNDINCLALQGAFVENMTKVAILGMANEPIDLVAEGGTNAYYMTELEMRAVLGSRLAWEIWLDIPAEFGGGGGFSRYGGSLDDSYVKPIIAVQNAINDIKQGKLKSIDRNKTYLAGQKYEKAGRVFEKLKSHAENTYGKRWAYDTIYDEIIDAAWTQDILAGNDDPNEFFRQTNGRTRCYVEYSTAAGAFSLGLSDLTTLFGSNAFSSDATSYGSNFTTFVDAPPAIELELGANEFSTSSCIITTDKSNYIYNDTANVGTRSALYVAASPDSNGIVTIDSPVLESAPSVDELILKIISTNQALGAPDVSFTTADGVNFDTTMMVKTLLNRFYGINAFRYHAKAFQPKFVYVPTRSKYIRYGPVFSSNMPENFSGKLEIIQDDSFAPWEYGGTSLMTQAMQIKVDNASSNVINVQTGNVNTEGYPLKKVGDFIGFNSNITNISVSFGEGVTTNYTLQSFTRKFGELTQDELARLSLVALKRGSKITPENIPAYIRAFNTQVNKNFNGNSSVNKSATTGGARAFGE